MLVVSVRSERVCMVVEVEQVASIWLAMGGVANCYHVVEDI